jgi:hypothetical protein
MGTLHSAQRFRDEVGRVVEKLLHGTLLGRSPGWMSGTPETVVTPRRPRKVRA